MAAVGPPPAQTVYGALAPLDVLAAAPHPDDAEIGCGGTLLALAAAGHTTGVLELTRGEMGTLGTPAVREAECVAAAEVLGLRWRGNQDLPDGDLHDDPTQALAAAATLRRLRPRLLLIPSRPDRHPDHKGAHDLLTRAVHLAALARAPLPGEPHRTARVLTYQGNAPFAPTVLVDVSAHLTRWEAAILAHASQFSGPQVSETVGPAIIERRRARLSYWGTFAGVPAAEGLQALGPLPVAAGALLP